MGDFGDADWAAPDFEFHPDPSGPDGGRIGGVDLMTANWRDFLASWEGVSSTAEEFVESGDRVLVITRFRGHGRASGVTMDQMPAAAIFTVRDGKVARLELFTNPAEARTAL